MSFSKLWEIVKDREAWLVRSRRESDAIEQLNNNKLVEWILETGRICCCTPSHLQSISDGAAVPGCSLSESEAGDLKDVAPGGGRWNLSQASLWTLAIGRIYLWLIHISAQDLCLCPWGLSLWAWACLCPFLEGHQLYQVRGPPVLVWPHLN